MKPLDPKSFHILVVLAARPLHGYAIRQEVEARSEGALRLWPATLYGTLSDLADRGWIEEAEGPEPADDRRRRYYALTTAGRAALEDEVRRLEGLTRLARAQLRAAGAG